MDARHSNFFQYCLILGLFCLFYFLYSQLTLDGVIPVPTPDGSYEVLKNAMTPGKRAIKSFLHILILLGLLLLLKTIEKEWGWDVLPFRNWLIRIGIANFVILIISQIIITTATFILTGTSFGSIIDAILQLFAGFWQQYEQNNINKVGISIIFVYLFFLWVWTFAKLYIPEMILTSFILVGYILLNINQRIEGEKWQTELEEQQLKTQVKEAEIKEQQLKTQVKEAELEALKSQIDSHFLSNLFLSIKDKMNKNRKTRKTAQEMISKLSELFYFVQEIGGTKNATLEEEIKIVEHYLDLNEVLYKERLNYELKIESEMNAKFLPMVIQPIVENAIKYGIDPHPDGGKILIQTTTQKTFIEVCIVNTGQLKKNVTHNGKGLENIEKRLSYFYDAPVQLKPEKVSKKWVCEKFQVPCRTIKEKSWVCVTFQVPLIVEEQGDKV